MATVTTDWHEVGVLNVASPVLSVLALEDGWWAGGPGGIAMAGWDRPDQPPRVSVPGIRAVAGLARTSDAILAGGADGIVRSEDGGRTWRLAEVQGVRDPVAAIVASQDTALAATLGSGIARSTDGGRTWSPATFGLASHEVTALTWPGGDETGGDETGGDETGGDETGGDETVVAGTAAGLFRSDNGGRAWRVVPGTEDLPVAAVTMTAEAYGVAVCEDGTVLVTGNGIDWERRGALPDGAVAMALHHTSSGATLAATATHGILRSADGGVSWSRTEAAAFCFAEHAGTVLAGLAGPVWRSDDGGLSWQHLATPRVHDLVRLETTPSRLFAYGAMTGLVRYEESEVVPLEDAPLPLTAVRSDPRGGLFASSPDGLWRSPDDGTTWEQVVAGESGCVHHLTFALSSDSAGGPGWGTDDNPAAGAAWAAGQMGDRVLRSADGGASWEEVAGPLARAELVAVEAVSDAVLAATYEPSRRIADLWRRDDEGGGDEGGGSEGGDEEPSGWRHTARASMTTLAVATCGDPPAAALGRTWMIQDTDGTWRRGSGPDGTIRRLAGRGEELLALTDRQLAFSVDRGRTWNTVAELDAAEVVDVAVGDEAAFVLLTGGRLWSRARG